MDDKLDSAELQDDIKKLSQLLAEEDPEFCDDSQSDDSQSWKSISETSSAVSLHLKQFPADVSAKVGCSRQSTTSHTLSNFGTHTTDESPEILQNEYKVAGSCQPADYKECSTIQVEDPGCSGTNRTWKREEKQHLARQDQGPDISGNCPSRADGSDAAEALEDQQSFFQVLDWKLQGAGSMHPTFRKQTLQAGVLKQEVLPSAACDNQPSGSRAAFSAPANMDSQSGMSVDDQEDRGWAGSGGGDGEWAGGGGRDGEWILGLEEDGGGPADLRGDINKLSHALAAGPAAEPMELGGPGPAGGAGGGSDRAPVSGRQSESSQRVSALGDEVLSQDDILDGDFIGGDIPANLENCLALNAAYQEVVDENLAELERLLRENRERQQELRGQSEPAAPDEPPLHRGVVSGTPRYDWGLFVLRYFADAAGFGPLPNADAKAKLARGELETLRTPRPWLQSEREALFAAVLEDARRLHTRDARHRLAVAVAALCEETERPAAERDPAAERLLRQRRAEAERELRQAEQTPILEMVAACPEDGHDWLHISQTDLAGQRRPLECRLQWRNFVRPSISHAEWTPEEDERVMQVRSDSEPGNRWQRAADELGRTAFQVFQRYMTALTPVERHFWTAEETDRLLRVVASVRMGNYIEWPLVASRMPGFNVARCRARYQRVQSRMLFGRFTLEEDLRLMAAVEVAGLTDWRQIAELLPGRLPSQLSNRYRCRVATRISHQPWTREEDEALVRLVRDLGTRWEAAAASLKTGRNGVQCRSRFKQIMLAYETRGALPPTGSLADEPRTYSTTYYRGLRDELDKRLARYLPAGSAGDPAALREAALAFLQPVKRPSKSKRRVLQRPETLSSRTRSKLFGEKTKRVRNMNIEGKWRQLGALLHAEGRQPYRRLAECAPAPNAAAAAATARAWSLPAPGPRRLLACAAAGPPVSETDSEVLQEWAAALQPGSDSAARRQVAAVGGDPHPWRRMPLLPPSYNSCSMFRSLLLLRSEIERHVCERHGPRDKASKSTVQKFNAKLSQWSAAAMSGNRTGAASSTPWLERTDLTRHRDRMVTVRVTQRPPGQPQRAFVLTVAAEEADDPQKLAATLQQKIPHLVRMDVSRAPDPKPAPRAPAGPPPARRADPASADDAWHLLTSRFVSLFFWPALLSLQPPPEVQHLDAPEELDIIDRFGGQISVAAPAGDPGRAKGTARRARKRRARRASESGPSAKRPADEEILGTVEVDAEAQATAEAPATPDAPSVVWVPVMAEVHEAALAPATAGVPAV